MSTCPHPCLFMYTHTHTHTHTHTPSLICSPAGRHLTPSVVHAHTSSLVRACMHAHPCLPAHRLLTSSLVHACTSVVTLWSLTIHLGLPISKLYILLTVGSKTVAKQWFLSTQWMWRFRAWEWRLVLAGKSEVLRLGYQTVFWSCDLAQYWRRYVHFELGLPLQWFLSF